MSDIYSIVSVDEVKSLLRSVVSFDEQETTGRFDSNTKGFGLTDLEIERYKKREIAKVLRYLSKTYTLPLQTPEGETDPELFSSETKDFLNGLFLDAIVLAIVTFAFPQQGNTPSLRDFRSNIKSKLEESINFALEMDTAGGFVYPRLSELKLNDLYMPREENIIPEVTYGRNTRYAGAIDRTFKLGGGRVSRIPPYSLKVGYNRWYQWEW